MSPGRSSRCTCGYPVSCPETAGSHVRARASVGRPGFCPDPRSLTPDPCRIVSVLSVLGVFHLLRFQVNCLPYPIFPIWSSPGYTAEPFEQQYNVPPQESKRRWLDPSVNNVKWRAKSGLRWSKKSFCARFVQTDGVAPSPIVRLFVVAPGHIGAALGEVAANRRIRSRIVRYNRRGTATSASWNVMYRACRTIFAPILISLSRSVVNVQCLTLAGSASRRRKLPRLYASTCSWSRT